MDSKILSIDIPYKSKLATMVLTYGTTLYDLDSWRSEGFIKKDQVRFDEKHKNKTCNSDLLYNHFYRENEKLQVLEKDTDLAEIIIDYLKGLSFKAIERELSFEGLLFRYKNKCRDTKNKKPDGC